MGLGLLNFSFINLYLLAGDEQMLLARQDELRLASLLAELQQFPVFDVQQFETAIDSIRTCVAEVRRLFLTSVKIFMSAETLETCCRRFQFNWSPICESVCFKF